MKIYPFLWIEEYTRRNETEKLKKKRKKKEKNRWKKLIKGKFQDAIEIRQR